MHSLKFRKDKRLIIKGEPYPENYNFSFKLFKVYSQFFSNNIEYKYMDDIVFHYPSQISTSSFIQFIKSCQNEEFTIDQDNIFDLLVLSEIFQVEILKKQIDLHIKNTGPPMIIQSLQYKFNLLETNQQQDLCLNINSISEEKAIGEILIQFLQNEQYRDYLISLPMNMLYNILRTYNENNNSNDNENNKSNDNENNNSNDNENNNSNDNENQNNDNKDILIDFLVDVLQKHGRTASVIFSIFDFGERKLDVIKKISKKDIDYKCINDLLISVFDDVLKENEQIKDETTNQLNELRNQISILKNQIDIHFGISSIVQENIIRNNGDDDLETVDFENDESARQLGKHYYQEILSTLLMSFDEGCFQNFDSKLKKKIILEYCRLALNNLLNDDQIIELLKYMNKRQKDELIFLLAYKGQLPVSIINLKREIKHARIPSNITDVDDSLFDDFPSIESVSLHKNVQSLSNIKTKLPQLKEIIITYSSQEKTLDLLNSVYEINGPTKSNDNFKVKSIIKYENGIKKISKIFDKRIEFKKLIKQFILPPSTLLIEPGSFVSCNLEEMKIPPRIIIIPDRCFSDCSMLKKVIIPNSVKIIEEKAFYLCKSLTEIILPNSIEVIKDSTFEYSGLKKIKLPPLLKTVQKYTFSNCIALEEVEFNVNLELIEADAFLECTALLNANLSKCTKVVYEESSFPSNCEIIEPQNDF